MKKAEKEYRERTIIWRVKTRERRWEKKNRRKRVCLNFESWIERYHLKIRLRTYETPSGPCTIRE